MTAYLDTSVIVSALTRETATARAQAWLGGVRDERLVISDWVEPGVSSALALKARLGALTNNDRSRALAAFNDLLADSLDVVAVERLDFQTAARFADRYAPGVRAGDALHLAVCMRLGLLLCTLDRRLGEAGPALGVSTRLL